MGGKPTPTRGTSLRIRITTSTKIHPPIFLALFRTPLPEGRPVICGALPRPGTYTLHGIPGGNSWLWAAALTVRPTAAALAAFEHQRMDVAYVPVPSSRRGYGRPAVQEFHLRRATLFHPPIVSAAPLFMAESLVPEKPK